MMGVHSHRLTRKRIHRMFRGALSVNARRHLFAKVDGCRQCRALLRRYYQFEGALFGPKPEGDLIGAADRMEAAILASVRSEQRKKAAVWPKLSVAVAVSMVAALCIWRLNPVAPHRVSMDSLASAPASELVSRGGISNDADTGIRAFSVSKQRKKVRETSALSLNDLLTFTYSKALPETGYLALFGIQESGEVIWYYPDFGEASSIPIAGDRIDTPLKDGFDVSIHHHRGRLVIVALFSDRPISTAEINDIVRKKRRETRDAVAGFVRYRWPKLGKGVTVHTMLLEVEN